MATDILVPVALPLDSADYITSFGTATTLYLEYGTATTPADGTATTAIVSGTEHYEFWVPAASNSYFRWRIGGGSDYTAYSPTFQVPTAYATLQEVVRGMDLPDTSRYDELEALLVEASDHITHRVCGGRRFFRDPVGTGTRTVTLTVVSPRKASLAAARFLPLDIVSLTSVGIADHTGDTFSTLDAADYYLKPDMPASGHPYTDLVLSDQASTYISFPVGRTVQLTGVFGWSAVPDLVRRATVDLVRFWYSSRRSDGEPVGMSAFGAPIFGAGLPKSVKDLAASAYAWQRWVG